MNTKVFINLAVADLEVSKTFYASLGFTINQQFTNDHAAGIVVNDHIYLMLLTHDFFRTFTTRELVDARKSAECLNALSTESREEVDAFVARALAVGGTAYNEPQDHGFMYSRGFQDPDGHSWDIFWMNPATIL